MNYSKCDECAKHPHFSQIKMNCFKGIHGWNCAAPRYKYAQRHKNGANQAVDFLKLLKGDPSFISNLRNSREINETMANQISVLQNELNTMKEQHLKDMKSLMESFTYKKSAKSKEDSVNAY